MRENFLKGKKLVKTCEIRFQVANKSVRENFGITCKLKKKKAKKAFHAHSMFSRRKKKAPTHTHTHTHTHTLHKQMT